MKANLIPFSVASIDDPETFHGMPVGLQIMGRRLEEEKMLAIAVELERIL